MNGHVKVKDMTLVFDVRHISTYLLLTRVYVQERYFWLVRCVFRKRVKPTIKPSNLSNRENHQRNRGTAAINPKPCPLKKKWLLLSSAV
jgi:hypothetical protein